MSHTVHVVDGEASESDSEVEVGRSPETEESNSKGFVITGEASESDDESKLQSPKEPPVEKSSPLNVREPEHSPSSKMMYNSLLHQKLWECNVSLRATLEGLVRHTTDISVEKLTRADKQLLNVQESVRSTNANLALARARLRQLGAQLDKAGCGGALPSVRVRQ